MKPPIQNFDATPLVRFRVRGTKGQVKAAHEAMYQLERERCGMSRGVELASSGPVGDGAAQWASSFYVIPTLAPRVKDLLFALGLDEET